MRILDIDLILVPTDFSLASDGALDAAIDLARLSGAPVEILHVNLEAIWSLPPPGDIVAVPVGVDMTAALADSAIQLEAVVSRVRAAGITCTGVSLSGRTDAEIVEYARTRGAGLIVVGSHGKHGFARVVVGGVAEKVVRHAPCPILVVPELEKEAPRVSSDEEAPALMTAELQPA